MAKLEFILGRAGAGKTETCLCAMCAKMEREPIGRPLLLIVPEHMTYQAERTLAERMGSGGTMRSVVSGFRRLAWRAAEEKLPRMTEIGKRLILKKIVERRAEELTALARGAGQRGFTAALAETIEELKACHGTPTALREAAELVENKHLGQKLSDISILYGDFLEETKNRFEDAEDRMEKLAAAVQENPFFSGIEVWLDGFVFFNPQERDVLRAFLRTADDVHITLPLDRDVDVQEDVGAAALFYRAARTLQLLKQLADEEGVSYTTRVLGAPRRFAADAQGLAAVERGLFRFPIRAERHLEKTCGVCVIEAATRRLEMETAVADMVRLCREEGFRWRDIGVLLRDADNYGELLEYTLKEYGVPFFSDRKRAGVHHPLAELVRSALETLTGGWDYDDVFRCVKTDLFPLTRDEADILENYVLEFGVRGRRAWSREWQYFHMRPAAFGTDGAENEARGKERLETLNRIRNKVATPFAELSEAMRAADVAGKTRAMYEFLLRLDVPDTLASWTEDAEKAGLREEAKEHRMIWGAVMELFQQMATVAGEDKVSLSDYAALLADGLDALEISLIPQGIDSVTIASFDQNSLNNIRALYIFGANEGVMPRRPSVGGLLSDADRTLLAAEGGKVRLEFARTMEEESCGENYLLYHGFTEAKERLWVSYALADSEGQGIGASSVVARLLKLLSIPLRSVPLEGMERNDELLFTTGARAVSRLAPALREYVAHQGKKDEMAWAEVYNWALSHSGERLERIVKGALSQGKSESLPSALARQIFTRGQRFTGSVTQFENYHACPFLYFAKYGLHLQERAERGFRPLELGILLHDVMRRFGEKMRREGRAWSDVSPEERAVFVRETVAGETAELQNAILTSTAQYRALTARIEETADSAIARLSAWNGASEFVPRFFELSFGEGKAAGPVLSCALSNGISLDVTGQIDRIDCMEARDAEGGRQKYFLILDYKTGEAELDVFDVYYGLRLQLLTYMEAAARFFRRGGTGEAFPAGVLYCALKNPAVRLSHKQDGAAAAKELASRLRMTGWLLNDPSIVRSVDPSEVHIRVRLTKNGIHGQDRGKVKTAKEFAMLSAHTMKMLQTAGQNALQGEISASPYRTKTKAACAYCPFGDVCGFDPQIGYNYRKLDDSVDFLKEMEKEEKEEIR